MGPKIMLLMTLCVTFPFSVIKYRRSTKIAMEPPCPLGYLLMETEPANLNPFLIIFFFYFRQDNSLKSEATVKIQRPEGSYQCTESSK